MFILLNNIFEMIILKGTAMKQKNVQEKNFLIQPYSYKNFKQNFLICIVVIMLLLIMFCKPIFHTGYSKNVYDIHLINSILNGKINIGIEPSEELKNMQNPYNYNDRIQEGVKYLFDTAYYNGHYFVYFGIVPAIILFIPFYLLTGTYMSVEVGTQIFVIVSIIINIMLSIKIYNKWFKNIPFLVLFVFIISNLISGLYIWNTWRMWNYELTLLSGFFFVQLGVYLIINAIECDEEDNTKKCSLYTFTACFSMALAVGCRPTLVISSILMIPFLLKLIKGKNGKGLVKQILIIVIPYLIVAIPLMWYNYVRFGSVLEFGARYQLTAVDVNNTFDRFKDIPKGLYDYYLTPPKISQDFPYIVNSVNMEGHTKNYYNGCMVCGIVFLNMTLAICLFGIKYYKIVKDKLLKNFMIVLPLTAIIMSIIIIIVGGTLQRYVVDYLWMFSTLSMILWMLAYQNANKKNKLIILIIISILIVLSILVNIFGTYFNSEYNFYNYLKHLNNQ